MILTGPEIMAYTESGDIVINPFDEKLVNPASVDLRLGDQVAIYKDWVDTFYPGYLKASPNAPEDGRYLQALEHVFDTKQKPRVETFKIDPHLGWILKPGIGYLMHTLESVWTDKFVPVLDGKALALDTDIPTPKGWRKMVDLSEGDLVYGANGRPTKVLYATKVMKGRPCYEVTFRDGTSLIADGSHQWFVHPVDARPGLRTTEQLAQRRHRRGATIFRIPATPVYGTKKKLPVKPYTLGAWLGDGTTVCANITTHDTDHEILEEIRGEGYTVELRARKGSNGTYLIGRGLRKRDTRGRLVSEGSLHTILRRLGLLKGKFIPNVYKTASYAQRWALLQGLMDTDGTIHRDGQASITLCNKVLFEDVEELCKSLGLVVYRDERPAKISGKVVGTAYRLTWRATPELFRLNRKQSKVRSAKSWLESARHPLRGISSVKPVNSVPVRCITVEAEDGLFLATKSYIATHNSSIGRLFVTVHVTAGYGDPNFKGQYTLEVSVTHPVRVYPGMRIAQMRFHTMVGDYLPYQGNYTGEDAQGPVASKVWKQFQKAT